ncbi:hypothetical protein D1B32_19205 [Oceanobacillus profundus]|uniref:Uncharacterized protein n=1 Tax=Oceanobacillus profundus TaxID=372463 RepID=A0A417YBK3_9BACI|nr:hypothetical protein CHI07_17475 [Paenibacillus sp. 7884-2]RHW29985.1 hypothetical protein D1B32_19205 [Oceanobacillus profundus]
MSHDRSSRWLKHLLQFQFIIYVEVITGVGKELVLVSDHREVLFSAGKMDLRFSIVFINLV